MKKIGAATALEVRATGIPYVFAPCIAVIYILCSKLKELLPVISSTSQMPSANEFTIP